MISCTEFIPLYSELFKYLEKKQGFDGVMKYWIEISNKYVEPRLGEEIKANGLKGCWNYWNKSLNEEACDFTMEYDEEKQIFQIVMRGCPSKGMLLKLGYTNPYEKYCKHCDVLYSHSAKKYGIDITVDDSECDKAKCIVTAKPTIKGDK
ncbi:MAG: hypothetical protein J6V66_07550 [Clostridia bacterium]|nr:hypothetical protein [Clostridia bacterium]